MSEEKNKMNWNEIRLSCPNAFATLVVDHNTVKEWGEIDNPEIWGDLVDEPHWVMRHLYDFFDSKGIIVQPCYFWMDKYWGYEIFTDKANWYESTDYNTREKAEVAVLTKAFEILEAQLSDKSHD